VGRMRVAVVMGGLTGKIREDLFPDQLSHTCRAGFPVF